MSATPIDELHHIMDINVWSNKLILDWLLQSPIAVGQIILISSGSTVLANKGWGAYTLSKTALNVLARMYAHEFSSTHISAIAPGLIESQMMDYICEQADSDKFPALKRIQQARGTKTMLTPTQAAERIISSLVSLKAFESGSYVDLRQILAPEEYDQLMNFKVT
jgi:NAD(P)-dependent dehydrogenase (short-subunit alcohol dehydrogenase family)